MAYKEKILKEFEPIGFNDSLKVRLVERESKERKAYIVLDIRQYMETDKYTGFTKRGISLGFEDLQQLVRILPQAITVIDESVSKKSSS